MADLAIASGAAEVPMAEKGHSVTGVESTARLLAQARNRRPQPVLDWCILPIFRDSRLGCRCGILTDVNYVGLSGPHFWLSLGEEG